MDKRYFGILIFILLFIAAISMIAILIAKGYNFTGSEIRENGILNIASTPEGARIYINGEEKATTPKKIELATGQYELKITKDNYREWKKQIQVEASIVTDITVKLFPIELSTEQLTFSSIDKAFFSSDGDVTLYSVTTGTNPGIWLIKLEKTIFELSSSQPTKIVEYESSAKQCIVGGNYNLQIASDKSRAILQCNYDEYKEFYLIDLKSPGSQPLNINNEIGFSPDSIEFGFDANTVFAIDNEIIAGYNISTKTLNLISRKRENYTPQLTPFGKDYLLLEYSYDGKTRYLYRLASNLTKSELNLGNEVNLRDISSISGSTENLNMFVLTTSEYSALCTITQGLATIIPFSQGEINSIHWSPKGLSFLFLEGNVLKSADIKNYPDNTVKVETYTLIEEYNSASYTFIWAINSEQVLVNDLTKNKIYAMDKDGSNQTLLFEGALTFPQAFKLSANGTFLVLLLEDDEGYSNLYSVKLKI